MLANGDSLSLANSARDKLKLGAILHLGGALHHDDNEATHLGRLAAVPYRVSQECCSSALKPTRVGKYGFGERLLRRPIYETRNQRGGIDRNDDKAGVSWSESPEWTRCYSSHFGQGSGIHWRILSASDNVRQRGGPAVAEPTIYSGNSVRTSRFRTDSTQGSRPPTRTTVLRIYRREERDRNVTKWTQLPR